MFAGIENDKRSEKLFGTWIKLGPVKFYNLQEKNFQKRPKLSIKIKRKLKKWN